MTQSWEKVSSALIDSNFDTFGNAAVFLGVNCEVFGIFSAEYQESDIGTVPASMELLRYEVKTLVLEKILIQEGTKIKMSNNTFSIVRIESDGKPKEYGLTTLILRAE